MNILAIVQARLGSSRFPSKVLKKINGKSVVSLIYGRLSKSKMIDDIVVAISNNPKDNKLFNHLKNNKIKVFRGSENNVLDRFYKTAKFYKANWIVRITADCPLIDANIVDNVIKTALSKNIDFSMNTCPPSFPDGYDVECFSMNALKITKKNANKNYELEHVTPNMRFNKKINKLNYCYKENFSNLRLTLDNKEDLRIIKNVYKEFYPDIFFGIKEVINLYKKKPIIFKRKNKMKKINNYSKAQKLWQKAKKIIPGGNMLLSKRPEMYLPNFWPTYFSKTKGCELWDIEKRKFFDFFLMGVGTNILGYSNKKVDRAVKSIVNKGNMSSLNCAEEVKLAEKLVEIHPWSKMVKFARSGGEANSIAIRIARAASGKNKIAVCGYHGWHDWYLSANLTNNSNLNNLLLKNLPIKGVPNNLKNTVYTFEYNDFEKLKQLINKHKDIGVIKMEVKRNIDPKNNFLKKIRKIASEKNIVLIFDECTSGFRENFGGLHKKYKVNPDMAIFGKSLGNGYAITAIIGRKEVMEEAQNSFISSTFWTERIGPTAGIATLDFMEKNKTWKQISDTGNKIKKKWNNISEKLGLEVNVSGIASIPNFSFESKKNLIYKTYLTQEMLKRGYMAGNIVYVCTEHEKFLNKYFENFEEVMFEINQFDKGNKRNIEDLLDGPVCHETFQRLN